MDSTTDGYGSFLNGGDIGVTSIWEYDGSVGSLHDNLKINIPFAQDSAVMLRRDLHGHNNRYTSRQARAEMIHQEKSCLLHPGALPLAPLHNYCGCVEVFLLLPEKTTFTTIDKNLKYLNMIWMLYWS